jgi:uncharacterized protein YjbI with pentapeptide repeats
MTTDTTTTTDPAPRRGPTSRLAQAFWCLGPLVVLVILGGINSIGAWPAFRQQDSSILHLILASNSEALKGLNQDIKSEGSDSGKDIGGFLRSNLGNPLRNYLTLENINLSGLDLSSSDLSDMSLENVNLAGAQLVNSDFSCTDLTRVDFSGAKAMNSRFNYSNCNNHISTNRSRCSGYVKKFIDNEIIKVSGSQWPFGIPQKTTCLEANFVGADFSNAQISGNEGRSKNNFNYKSKTNFCKNLLVLVGDMSGANFSNARLICVALIHRPLSMPFAPPASKEPSDAKHFTFNGISFADARLDRVALLTGPFRFTNFERATLMGLFLNIGDEKKEQKAELDYSKFNEISCNAPNKAPDDDKDNKAKKGDKEKKANKDKPLSKEYMPCLWVQRSYHEPKPLRLSLLWSNLATNLEPIKNDAFLCTPLRELPALVGATRIKSAVYWLSTKMESSYGPELKPFECPALDDQVLDKPHHLLQPKKL